MLNKQVLRVKKPLGYMLINQVLRVKKPTNHALKTQVYELKNCISLNYFCPFNNSNSYKTFTPH